MKPRASVGKNGCVQLTFQIEMFFRVNNKKNEETENLLTTCSRNAVVARCALFFLERSTQQMGGAYMQCHVNYYIIYIQNNYILT